MLVGHRSDALQVTQHYDGFKHLNLRVRRCTTQHTCSSCRIDRCTCWFVVHLDTMVVDDEWGVSESKPWDDIVDMTWGEELGELKRSAASRCHGEVWIQLASDWMHWVTSQPCSTISTGGIRRKSSELLIKQRALSRRFGMSSSQGETLH